MSTAKERNMAKQGLPGVTVIPRDPNKPMTNLMGPGHNHSRVKEADGSINISQSKVKSWRQCRKQYDLKYVQLLTKKKIKRPFTFGSIVHKMLEDFAEGDDPFEYLDNLEIEKGAYFRREREMYGDILKDVRLIMEEYFSYWEEQQYGDLRYIRKNKRSSEHEFRIELKDGLWFTGRIDAVVKSKKMNWLLEHKSFKKMMTDDDRWRSVQGATYFRALQIMGWPEFDGILWDNISSKPPTNPSFTEKTGKLSQAKIVTLPGKVREFLKENKLSAKDYPKLMSDAKENRSTYFQRQYMPIKEHVVDHIWNDFVETALEITDLHGLSSVRNVGRHCTWCDYELLCRTEMSGRDVDFVIRREYVVDKDGQLDPKNGLDEDE